VHAARLLGYQQPRSPVNRTRAERMAADLLSGPSLQEAMTQAGRPDWLLVQVISNGRHWQCISAGRLPDLALHQPALGCLAADIHAAAVGRRASGTVIHSHTKRPRVRPSGLLGVGRRRRWGRSGYWFWQPRDRLGFDRAPMTGGEYAGVMVEDAADTVPYPGMVISVLTRQDVVIMDPQRFLAAAREACRTEDPDLTEDEVIQAVADVYDAVQALVDRYGSVASEHPDVAAGATPQQHMHGGVGLLPGDRVQDRPDGLSPAGSLRLIAVGEPRPLQDYGCFLPEPDDLFTAPIRRATSH
jgi:hypothetical protein